MVSILLDERTQEFLGDPLLGEKDDIDTKIRQLIEREYLHQSARHRRTDSALTEKYGMDFETFVAQRIVKERLYSWEVEQDAVDWGTAIGGIETVKRKLRELKDVNPGQHRRST